MVLMRAWDGFMFAPCITISFVSFKFMSLKYGLMWGNPLMEYMKERKDFKDLPKSDTNYFSVTMVKRGRISKLAGLILGLLERSSGESDKDLYYSLTFLDFIRDYRCNGDDFQQVKCSRCSSRSPHFFFSKKKVLYI
jgi:hypothetical protein